YGGEARRLRRNRGLLVRRLFPEDETIPPLTPPTCRSTGTRKRWNDAEDSSGLGVPFVISHPSCAGNSTITWRASVSASRIVYFFFARCSWTRYITPFAIFIRV